MTSWKWKKISILLDNIKKPNVIISGLLSIFRKETEIFSRLCALKSWMKMDQGHQFVFYWQVGYFLGKALFSGAKMLCIWVTAGLWFYQQKQLAECNVKIEELTKLIATHLTQTASLLFRLYWIKLSTPQGSAGNGWHWLNLFLGHLMKQNCNKTFLNEFLKKKTLTNKTCTVNCHERRRE